MRTFSEYKESRKSLHYNESVEQKHKSYMTFMESILLEMGVSSPTELTPQRYDIFISRMKNFNETGAQNNSKGNGNVAKQQAPIFELSNEQKAMVKNIVNSIPLEDAKLKLESVFSKKLPDVFESIEVKGNSLSVNFKNSSYKFNKEVSLLEKDITSDAEFKKYAEDILKDAHGDNYDDKIAQETIDGLIKKYDGDYGAMVGALTSGFGQ